MIDYLMRSVKAVRDTTRQWCHLVPPEPPLNRGSRALLQPDNRLFNVLPCAQTALSGKMRFATPAPRLIASDFAATRGALASSEIGLINKPTKKF